MATTETTYCVQCYSRSSSSLLLHSISTKGSAPTQNTSTPSSLEEYVIRSTDILHSPDNWLCRSGSFSFSPDIYHTLCHADSLCSTSSNTLCSINLHGPWKNYRTTKRRASELHTCADNDEQYSLPVTYYRSFFKQPASDSYHYEPLV
ncbi:hypothetical protein N7508_002293 [Penicillium antarcticum]|uniref:uncharacterized protein n=1 Tax=Penicillium antarcticum TaxID=416450 RepID=UPI002384E920|nr:uncharacterized protein N7508_002293 [Penicillium antarcticum]KAJ5317785.1 hypothetical protein N7508_002293 [Penicillium antarcticum]